MNRGLLVDLDQQELAITSIIVEELLSHESIAKCKISFFFSCLLPSPEIAEGGLGRKLRRTLCAHERGD